MRERFEAEGLEDDLLHRKPKRTKPRKLDGSQEAHLISLACSEPPKGRDRWSVRFLAERFVSFECVSRKRGTEALENKGAPEWEPPNGSPRMGAPLLRRCLATVSIAYWTYPTTMIREHPETTSERAST